jgi:Asp/Glu/hydantoin racemase
MTIAKGGKSIYSARLGILMLETRFPRIAGDMGNAETWPFPVLYKVVRGAAPKRVVMERAAGLLDVFLEGAAELVALGADGITTNCGFLSLFQREIAAHVTVPVATSSLMQIPMVQALLPPGKRVGVLTVSGNTLSRDHLITAGALEDTPFVGTENGTEFFRVLIGDEERLDVTAAARDILEAGAALIARYPEVGAIVLECTNMPPYAALLSERLDLPVFDIYSLITWFHAGLTPRAFGVPLPDGN